MDKFKILIIDDVDFNIYALETILFKNKKLDVCGVSGGFEALGYLDKHHIDLILCNVQMPQMDGFEFVATIRLRKKTADIPVIFITAHSKSQEFFQRAYSLDAIDYLVKPIDEQELNHKINSFHVFTIREREKNKEILQLTIDKAKAEEALYRSEKFATMGRMLGVIAHQWRQPLNVVNGVISNIEDAYDYNELNKEYLHDIVLKAQKNLNYMSETIDDFRNFFKPNKEKNAFDIKKSVEEIVFMQSNELEHNKIDLEVSGETFTFVGVKSELQQVLLNCITNSKDNFIEKKIINPKIEIKITDKKIFIQDNGSGVDEKLIERIFEPYFTTKDEDKGTGIGLYISKLIIENSLDGKLIGHNENNGFEIIIDLT